MPQYGQQPPAPKKSNRLPIIIGAAVLAFILLVGGGFFAFWMIGKPDRDYIAALKDNGDFNYATNAEAVAHGKEVCSELEKSGKAKGSRSDLAAAKSYCPKMAEGFKVMETKVIEGKFRLLDFTISSQAPQISTTGSTCTGVNKYAKINSGTTVAVTNSDGRNLASTTLGTGSSISKFECVFKFQFKLTEGEDSYAVKVADYRPIDYTWSELSTNGIALRVGL